MLAPLGQMDVTSGTAFSPVRTDPFVSSATGAPPVAGTGAGRTEPSPVKPPSSFFPTTADTFERQGLIERGLDNIAPEQLVTPPSGENVSALPNQQESQYLQLERRRLEVNTRTRSFVNQMNDVAAKSEYRLQGEEPPPPRFQGSAQVNGQSFEFPRPSVGMSLNLLA